MSSNPANVLGYRRPGGVAPRSGEKFGWPLIAVAACILAFSGVGLFAYAAATVECPYCHNSNTNVTGKCVLRQRTGRCDEDYYGQHYNKATCSWCGGRGHMSRAEAWLD